jgi:hypothetical protein
MSWALPPEGLVSVALHTSQAMDVVAREKMVHSLPQSRQLTFRNWLVIVFTSAVDQFEFLGSLARSVMRFAGFSAPVENVHSLRWLFSAVGLWTWETTVTRHDATESSLTPAQLRSALLLHTLHGVEGVLTSRGAVSLDLTGSLHHVNT